MHRAVGAGGARRAAAAVDRDDVSNAAFPYMTARAIAVAGVPVWAQRVTYVGELGWELYVAPADAPARAGTPCSRPAGAPGSRPVGYKALESLRLEKGYRYWSADITPSEQPLRGRARLLRAARQGRLHRAGRARADQGARAPSPGASATVADRWPRRLYGGEAVWRDGARARAAAERRATATRSVATSGSCTCRPRSLGRGHAPRGRGLRGACVRRGRPGRPLRPAGRAHPRLSGALRSGSSGSRGRRPSGPDAREEHQARDEHQADRQDRDPLVPAGEERGGAEDHRAHHRGGLAAERVEAEE